MSQPKYFKKISNESGSFTKDGNRNISWSVHPDSENDVDLSKSYIDFTMKIKDSEGTALTNESVDIRDLNSEVSYPSSAIVRNVRLVSDKAGVVEELRESNRLSTSLYHYMNTNEMKAGRSETQTGEKIQLNAGEAHLIVPLSDLNLGTASQGVKLTQQHGQCDLQVELEDAKSIFTLLNLSSTINWKNAAELTANTIVKSVTTSTTFATLDQASDALRTGSKWILGNTVFEVDTVELVTGNAAKINLAHPVYIGATITAGSTATPVFTDIDANLENVAAAGSPTTITINKTLAEAQAEISLNVPYAIYYNDGVTNKCYAFIREITALADAAPNTTATLSSAITFTAAATNGSLVRVYDECSWEITKGELVYCKTNASDVKAQEVEMYRTESMNIPNGVSEFRNQVLLPPNSTQCVLVQETDDKLCGDNNNVDKYRVAVDGVDKTNRDVEYSQGQPKSHELIVNQVLKPKALDQNDAWVIAEQLDNNKMVDFSLQSTSALASARLHVFKKYSTMI